MKPYIRNRLWIAGIAILIVFIYKTDFSAQSQRLYSVMSPVIISFLLSWFMVPVKIYAENIILKSKNSFLRRYSSVLSAFAVYILFGILVAFFIICLIPVLKTGISNAVTQFEVYKPIIDKYAGKDFLNRIIKDINPQVYISGAKSTISLLFDLGMSFIVLIYVLLEHRQLKMTVVEFAELVIGNDKTERLIYYFSKVNGIFIKYFYSKLISSLMLGAIVTAGFFIAGISHPVFFGIIVALFNMLPVFGSFISSVPIALLTFSEYGFAKALVSIGIIILGQQVENNILTPKIVGDTVGLSGFWIIFSIIAGGGLFGFWGLLVCVPVAATFKLIYSEYKIRKLH